MKLEENRLISYRVLDVLNMESQEWLWAIYRRLEASCGKTMNDVQKFSIYVKGSRIVVTIFEDDVHERMEIHYNNIFKLEDICIELNFWRHHPYIIADVVHASWAEGGRLDAR